MDSETTREVNQILPGAETVPEAKELPAQTVALLSYIDPIVAIVLSALLLSEAMTPLAGLGAALVLGAAVVSELPERR